MKPICRRSLMRGSLGLALGNIVSNPRVFKSAFAQNTNRPLQIGLLVDVSGPISMLGGLTDVTAGRMAVEDFGGTVLGRKIEIAYADHQSKVDVGSAIARKWFQQDGISMIASLDSSALALAVQAFGAEHKYLTVATAPGTADLTGKNCSPIGIHWTHNTYAFARSMAKTLIARNGSSSWFFIGTDNVTGNTMRRDMATIVVENGGNVVGSVSHPLGSADFSSYLLAAQSSGADIIALANAGADQENTVKQWAEFGLNKGKQQLVAISLQWPQVEAAGLELTQGLITSMPFFYGRDDETKAFAARFGERTNGRAPTTINSGTYTGILHYLKAVREAGTDDPVTVSATMKGLPVNDVFNKNVVLRRDGRLLNDMYVLQVKSPRESTYRHDDYKLLATVPGEDAYQSIETSGCTLFRKS